MSKILLIDDEEGVRYTFRRMLESAGHWVCEAEDGEEGFSRAVSHQPDLILLDWMLPKEDGLKVCERLKSDPATRNIPIALVTGKKTSAQEEEAWQKSGVDLYIAKPIQNMGEFLKAVQGLLHGLSGRRARDVAQYGTLIVNRKERLVSWNGSTYPALPTKLFDLLYHLVKKAPHVASRLYLIEKIWGDGAVKDREVDVAIHRLKKIIPPLAPYLECSPNVGYSISSKLSAVGAAKIK